MNWYVPPFRRTSSSAAVSAAGNRPDTQMRTARDLRPSHRHRLFGCSDSHVEAGQLAGLRRHHEIARASEVTLSREQELELDSARDRQVVDPTSPIRPTVHCRDRPRLLVPDSYFERYGLKSWPLFLDDFCKHWPTDADHTYVDFIRDREEGPPDRTGDPTDLRLTEKWTSSAKSVFRFDVHGSVAKSTHAGLPWLQRIREEVGDKVHFWPFDGWDMPEKKSVIAEVYPSILRNRYPKEGRTADQQDAFCVARWLTEMDDRGFLDRYFEPPLTEEERRIADLEGWILGIL